jgi:hypothetical protein
MASATRTGCATQRWRCLIGSEPTSRASEAEASRQRSARFGWMGLAAGAVRVRLWSSLARFAPLAGGRNRRQIDFDAPSPAESAID